MVAIDVPCQDCGAPVGLDDPACRACGELLSPDLRLALDERLEAASPDLRELRERVRSARYLLLVLAIAYAGVALIYLVVDGDTAAAPSFFVETYGHFAFAAVFLGLFVMARWLAGAAIALALGLFLLLQLLDFVGNPAGLFASFLGLLGVGRLTMKLGMLVLLCRAAVAAFRAHRLRESLVPNRALSL